MLDRRGGCYVLPHRKKRHQNGNIQVVRQSQRAVRSCLIEVENQVVVGIDKVILVRGLGCAYLTHVRRVAVSEYRWKTVQIDAIDAAEPEPLLAGPKRDLSTAGGLGPLGKNGAKTPIFRYLRAGRRIVCPGKTRCR